MKNLFDFLWINREHIYTLRWIHIKKIIHTYQICQNENETCTTIFRKNKLYSPVDPNPLDPRAVSSSSSTIST